MAELRKYGVQTTIYFPLIDYGTTDFEATPVTDAGADCEIIKDGGASTTCDNDFAHEGRGIYSLVLSATEMEAANIVVTIIDTATKTWEDQAVLIDTYGNASAEHALDLDTTVPTAAEIVNEWESQSQSDPTGFHVNVKEVNGTAQTANDNGADINAILLDTGTDGVKIGADAITSAKIADNAIAAEHLAAGAIDNATFAADVGSTAYATNIIALAVRKVLDELNLDHLMKTAVSNRATMPEVVDDTVLANLMTKTDGDTSDFDPTTDSLEAIRDSQTTLGAGAITFTYTLYTDETAETGPIASATVWVTTDEAGTNVVASGVTDTNGAVVFYLDAGTYYVWSEKAGYNFSNPDTETVA